MNVVAKKLPPLRNALTALLGATWVGALFWGHYERAGGGRFINTQEAQVLIWLLPVLLLVAATRAHWRAESKRSPADPDFTAGAILLAAMVLYLFTGATRDVWFYFIAWVPRRGDAMVGFKHGLNVFVLLVAILWPALLIARGRIRYALVLPVLLLVFQGLCVVRLLRTTGGDALYRDDHPSFMLRLDQGADILPHIEAYVPFWNGGVVDRAIGETGATGPTLLLWPLWRFAEIHHVYTYGFAFIYILLMPWMCVAALRWMGFGWRPAAIAGLLGLAVSHDYFIWVLHFGTLGAGISSTCILPFSALLYRLMVLHKTDWKTLTALTVVAFLLVQWPPGFVMAGVCVISLLGTVREWRLRPWLCLVGCGVAVMLLDARMLLAIITKSEALLGFVLNHPGGNTEEAAAVVGRSFREGWINVLLPTFKKMNPLLVFLGLAGLCVLRERGMTRWIFPPVLALLLIATWISPYFKELQLERMTLPMMFLAIVPASLLAVRCLGPAPFCCVPLQAALLGLLMLTGLNASRLYANQGPAPYTTLSPPVRNLAHYLKQNVPEGGRVLFAGHHVHAIGGGHIAYLPRLADREMMGCDYYHFPIKMVEYDFPPRGYREPEAMLKYLETYNVTHVLTCNERRREDLDQRGPPYHFEQTMDINGVPVHVFRVDRPASLFLQNSGQIEATFNEIDVRLQDAQADAVIKYNYHENLRASGSAELFPFPVDDKITLIGIHPHGTERVRIRYTSWF